MSVEGTSTGKIYLPVVSRAAEVEQLLAAARLINARPKPDPFLVYDLLGHDYDEARAVYRRMQMHLHPDHAASLPLNPAQRKEVDDACSRLSAAWAPIAKSKNIPSRSLLELAEPGTALTEDVIIVAASLADNGLRAVRETASDLFEAGRNLAKGWASALRRKSANSE